MEGFEAGGGKSPQVSPPAIFEHQSDVMEYFYDFLGRDDKVIKGFNFFISPVSTSLNSFKGTLKCGGFSKYRQNYDNLSKFFFISRNVPFTDLQPRD